MARVRADKAVQGTAETNGQLESQRRVSKDQEAVAICYPPGIRLKGIKQTPMRSHLTLPAGRHPGEAAGSPPSLKPDSHLFLLRALRLTLCSLQPLSPRWGCSMGRGSPFFLFCLHHLLGDPQIPQPPSESSLWGHQDYSLWLCQPLDYSQPFPLSSYHPPHTHTHPRKLSYKVRGPK